MIRIKSDTSIHGRHQHSSGHAHGNIHGHVDLINPSLPVSIVPATEKSDALVRRYFSTALSNVDMMNIVIDTTEALGMNKENTLFSHSTCSDEINQLENMLPNLLMRHWGEMFLMGGLAGVPFCGRTGFSAFSHHIPDGGHAFLLFAPHVAICTKTQKVGYYMREGQHHESTACGAAIAAYNYVKGTVDTAGARARSPCADMPLSEEDYEMDYLKREVGKHVDEIMNSAEPMVTLAYVTYDIVKSLTLKIINTDWMHHDEDAHFETEGHDASHTHRGSKMVLLGGISVNLDDSMPDYFVPLMFECREKDMKSGAVKTTDLLVNLV